MMFTRIMEKLGEQSKDVCDDKNQQSKAESEVDMSFPYSSFEKLQELNTMCAKFPNLKKNLVK